VKITETDEFLSEENWLIKGVVAKEKPQNWLDTCVIQYKNVSYYEDVCTPDGVKNWVW
jgi:hypothetical protein